jgi:uncharacterized protein YceH (UPF0502 family)
VFAVASVFVVAVVSLLITRVATIAFELTGMSHEAARFQARFCERLDDLRLRAEGVVVLGIERPGAGERDR